MKIIDKNTDFYDYFQNIYRDDSLIFDRRDSFLLTKKIVCEHIRYMKRWDNDDRNIYVLLQICNAFWLFLLTITEINNWNYPIDYDIELLSKWKNYDKERALLKVDIIDFGLNTTLFIYHNPNQNKPEMLVQAINTNDYKVRENLNYYDFYRGDFSKKDKIERHIPILKACGIANCIDPLEVYLSIEEYFSLEKTSSERRDPIGTTDIDRLETHGFDKKISFRGKR